MATELTLWAPGMPEALSSHLSLIPHPTLHMQDGFREGEGQPAGKDPAWPPLHDPKLMLFCTPGSAPDTRLQPRTAPAALTWPQLGQDQRSGRRRGHRPRTLSTAWQRDQGPQGLCHLAPAGDLGVDHASQRQGAVAAQRACRRPARVAGMEAARAPLPGRAPRLLLSWLGGSGEVTEPLSFLIGEMRIKAAPNSPKSYMNQHGAQHGACCAPPASDRHCNLRFP